MDRAPLLEIKGVTKYFGRIPANRDVHLTLEKGEIHALLGENGAGKSTLMNIVSGLYPPDEGSILLNGKPVRIRTPQDAIALGIGMIHQHFMLIQRFTVLENIILGQEIRKGMFLDTGKARQTILNLSQSYGLSIDPDAVVADLPVGLQQRVEILKALFRKSRILILDEPTAVLTPGEIKDLFTMMRHLRDSGISIIFITHKLKEVMAMADRITIMRSGEVEGVVCPAETDSDSLAKRMVGRSIDLRIEKTDRVMEETVFEVSGLTVSDNRGIDTVKDISFTVRKGEILGIAGVQGNGQTELAEAVTGLRPVKGGHVFLADKPMPPLKPRVMINHGLAHIPEDRQKHGLILSYPISENQVLCTYDKPPFARGMIRHHKAVQANSQHLIKTFNIQAEGPGTIVRTLSGGNQQKVIISRELSRDVVFLLASQPTRGLDVGAIAYIHQTLLKMRSKGIGILLISSELDEILALSDTILVMYEGRIVEKIDAHHASKEALGMLMSGGTSY